MVQVQQAQLGPGGDAELGVDLVEVVPDGVAAHEQLVGDLLVGRPLAGREGDLRSWEVSCCWCWVALAGGLAIRNSAWAGWPERRHRRAAGDPRPSQATSARLTSRERVQCPGRLGRLVILTVIQEVALGPDEQLLGVVVHSGLLLGRSRNVVAAVRRITAFPTGLTLDTVVLARDIQAEAAGRRAHAAAAHRQAAATSQREDEAAAQQENTAAARREGLAAAERHHALEQARIQRRYLPSFDEGDRLRLGVTAPAGQVRWLDAYGSTSSEGEDHYRLEAAYFLTPLPVDGLFTLVCGWPEIGLPETETDIILPDLAVHAAEAVALWDYPEDPGASPAVT